MAMAGLALLGIALVGVTAVVIDMVYGRDAALTGGAIALVGFVGLWLVLPLILRTKERDGAQALTRTSRPLDRPVN
jgi:uncharacterized membrane protein YuzA (DUF378 family)